MNAPDPRPQDSNIPSRMGKTDIDKQAVYNRLVLSMFFVAKSNVYSSMDLPFRALKNAIPTPGQPQGNTRRGFSDIIRCLSSVSRPALPIPSTVDRRSWQQDTTQALQPS